MSRLSAIRRLMPAEIIEPDDTAPRSIDEVRRRYDSTVRQEEHSRALIFLQLADRIPDGYRFTGLEHIHAWCKVQLAEASEIDVGMLNPIVLERLRLVANKIFVLLDSAGCLTADRIDQRTYLLNKAHEGWQSFRREWTGP